MDLNLILRICQEFYDENPMMITTLVIFVLVYAYYRARVVQLPLIHCIVAGRDGVGHVVLDGSQAPPDEEIPVD